MTERPDDRELEQYLQGDSKLSGRYRDASHETSPPDLDEAILARARAEAGRKPGVNRYLAPVALAASLVLGVNLAWNLYQVEPVPSEVQRLEEAAAPVEAPPPAPQAAPVEPAPGAPAPAAKRAVPAAKREAVPPQEADTGAATREREEQAAAQARAEDQAALARRSEGDSMRREMRQAESEAEPAAAIRSDPLEQMAKSASDARGMLPPGWRLLGRADYYEASIDETTFRSAPDSLVMWRTAPGVEFCGRLEAEVPAGSLAGKKVRLTAAARTQGAQGGSLFVSYSLKGQVQWPLATRPFPAADGAWLQAELTQSIPPGAERVVYGALLCGAGTLWLDDVHLEAVK